MIEQRESGRTTEVSYKKMRVQTHETRSSYLTFSHPHSQTSYFYILKHSTKCHGNQNTELNMQSHNVTSKSKIKDYQNRSILAIKLYPNELIVFIGVSSDGEIFFLKR